MHAERLFRRILILITVTALSSVGLALTQILQWKP